MGPQTVAEHIDGVVSPDLVLHGWDLARGAGLDDTLDPEELDRLWPGVNDIPDEMRIPEHSARASSCSGPRSWSPTTPRCRRGARQARPRPGLGADADA